MLGEVIHGYRVDRAMAVDKGGMGDVFLATHIDSGAEAVVKVLKPEMSAHRDIVARFFNEARAAASIHHPGIVQIHNVGYHGDRAYLLMERLRGDDLETRVKGGPLPVDRAIVFMRQTAGAIAAAHDRGIVHRDLKPANLFVVRDPDVLGGERVKVLDFGIAKLNVDAGAGKTQGVFGTPAYMSPEQCASSGAVDARADLYSLGCIFYELVCGRPPFGHGGIELIAAHLRDTPPPPRAIAPWLPPAVEAVILRLLEKQPDRRLPSCQALIAALDEASLASGMPAGTAPKLGAGVEIGMPAGPSRSFAPPTERVAKRGVGLWIGLGAVVIAGGAIAAVIATRGGSSTVGGNPPPPAAAGDASVAIAPAVTPDAAQVAVVTPDAAPAPKPIELKPIEPKPIEPKPIEPKPIDPKPGSGDLAARAKALREEGKSAMFANKYGEAAKLFRQSIVLSPDATTYFDLGVALYSTGDFGEARLALEAALTNNPSPRVANLTKALLVKVDVEIDKLNKPKDKGIPGPDPLPPPTDKSSADRAKALNDQGREATAQKSYPEALALFKQAYTLDPRPSTLFNIAFVQIQTGNCADARRSLQLLIGATSDENLLEKAKKLLARAEAC